MVILKSWWSLEEDLEVLLINALFGSQNLAIHLG